ncbi:type II iodothyronine deiodinase-like [Saccoglossus kowalevskii]
MAAVAEMPNFMKDRELVIRIMKRYQVLMLNEETAKIYNHELHPFKTDPSKLVTVMENIFHKIARQALEDNGVNPNELNYRLMSLIRRYYSDDSEAIVHSGSLHRLFNDYKDKADFLQIYLLEAHPRDGWTVGEHYSSYDQPKDIFGRTAAARRLIAADAKFQTFTTDLTDENKVRLVVDNMDNGFAETYAAQPDRVFVIEGGRMAYIGDVIKVQIHSPDKLMTDRLREWLQQRFP